MINCTRGSTGTATERDGLQLLKSDDPMHSQSTLQTSVVDQPARGATRLTRSCTTSQRSQEMTIAVRNTYCSLISIHVTTVFDAVPL
eukprot:5070932-Pyramimonas_sp.AAC.1